MVFLRYIPLVCALMLAFQQPATLRADDVSAVRRLPVVYQEAVPPPPDGEPIPTPRPNGDFPALPPDPYDDPNDPLPPLEDELFWHGGSYLYCPEGDHLNWPGECDEHAHYDLLRLPEWWQKPRPVTHFAQFLGADPIHTYPNLQWPNGGYSWEPRFVGYGGYQLFSFTFEQDNQRRDAIGHQLLVELDLRLTGTERFHVQFRPVGRNNTGGSYYQFSDPAGYVDNSTATPDRYWFEGEIASIFGGYVNPFKPADVHFVLGRFPFALHNTLLMNADLLGGVVNKNTIFLGDLSNLNIQLFGGREDVSAYTNAVGYVWGVNATADRKHAFYELTYAFKQHEFDSSRDAHYAAISRTQLYGTWVVAARAMAKIGDGGGIGSGQLFVVESNRTRYFDGQPLGVEYGVFYCNAFLATEGWSSIAGGNFNRLQSAFEVSPLVAISSGNTVSDNWGGSLGVQLFRHHADESIIPEIAFQSPLDVPVLGLGVRYLRKTSARTFFEVLGVRNFSDDPRFDRKGVFVAETILF